MNALFSVPNLLSLLRIALTPIFVWVFLKGGAWVVLAGVIFTLAGLTDTYDGYYARRYGVVTRLGAFLDPIADKILISTTLILFAMEGVVAWWVIAVIIVRDCVITFLRLKLIYDGTPLTTSDVGKFKTVAQFAAIFVMFVNVMLRGYMSVWLHDTMLLAITLIMYWIAAVTVYSGVDYLIKYQQFKKRRGRE